jgi:hypothetical protein
VVTKPVSFKLRITLRIGLDVSLHWSAICSFTFIYREAESACLPGNIRGDTYDFGKTVSQYRVSRFSSSFDTCRSLVSLVLRNKRGMECNTYENRKTESQVQTSFCKDLKRIASLVVYWALVTEIRIVWRYSRSWQTLCNRSPTLTFSLLQSSFPQMLSTVAVSTKRM